MKNLQQIHDAIAIAVADIEKLTNHVLSLRNIVQETQYSTDRLERALKLFPTAPIELLSVTIHDLKLPFRTRSLLLRHRIELLVELLSLSEYDLIALEGIGAATIADIKSALHARRLHLKPVAPKDMPKVSHSGKRFFCHSDFDEFQDAPVATCNYSARSSNHSCDNCIRRSDDRI